MIDHACTCSACAAGLEPFTVEHFRAWALDLRLDNGRCWRLEPFQEAYAEDLFRFTQLGIMAECWLVIPEGNGKSTLVGGLGLYYLEHFEMAAIPVSASSREQAENVYQQAEGFIVRSERMTELVPNVYEQAKGKREMEVPRFEALSGFRRIKHFLGGVLQIRAADERTGDGIIPRGLMVMDELHRQRGLGLYRLWVGKGEKLDCPIAVISTAGEPGSEFEETRDAMRGGETIERNGCHVRSLSESAVLHEWALPEDGDVEDLDLVAEANPLSTITPARLARKRSKKSWNLAHWRRFTCNLPTRSETSALTEAEWDAAATREPFPEIPEGVAKWVGLDVGWKLDCTAIVPLVVFDREHRRLGPATIIEPPDDGNMTKPATIKTALSEEYERGPIATVVMDTTRAADLASWIEEELGCEVIDRQQTDRLAEVDYARFMEALGNGWLEHSGDKGLRRHAMNAVAKITRVGKTRFDRVSPSRTGDREQQRARWIDALTAATMVHAHAAIELFGESEEEQEPLLAWV